MPAAKFDGLPTKKSHQHSQVLVSELAPGRHVDPEMGVLLLTVAHAEYIRDPPAADEVEHADLLGEPHRIPQWQRYRRQQDSHLLSFRRDGRREYQRGRQMPIAGPMMLRQHRQ